MPRRPTSMLTLAMLLAPLSAVAQEVGEDWLLEPITWSRAVEGLERVTIVNRFGAIRIGGTSGELATTAELHGMVQRHTDDPRLPEIVPTFADGALSLAVAYPGDAEVPSPPEAWRKRRIDLTVYVDQTVRLALETMHGTVLVKGFAGPVEVTSESGDVEVKTTGPVVARSKYGKIDTFLTGTALALPMELETVTGAIHLSLPWAAQPRALIETRGEISSDYSIGIEWLPDSSLKRGVVAAGDGSKPMVLRSERGNVRLLRRIDGFRSAPPEAPTSE